METNDQNNELPASNKTNYDKFGCTKTCDKTPSDQNCLVCNLNLLNEQDDDSNEELTTEEKITKVDNDLDRLKFIPFLLIQIYETNLEKRRRLVKDLPVKFNSSEKNSEIPTSLKDFKEKIGRKKTPVEGKMYDIGKKAGFFFFNKKNKAGWQLSIKYQPVITQIICAFFATYNGTSFSIRYMKDCITIGKNMKLGDGSVDLFHE